MLRMTSFLTSLSTNDNWEEKVAARQSLGSHKYLTICFFIFSDQPVYYFTQFSYLRWKIMNYANIFSLLEYFKLGCLEFECGGRGIIVFTKNLKLFLNMQSDLFYRHPLSLSQPSSAIFSFYFSRPSELTDTHFRVSPIIQIPRWKMQKEMSKERESNSYVFPAERG